MADLIVGSEECSILDICEKLNNISTTGQVVENLNTLILHLKIPAADAKKFKNQQVLGLVPFENILADVLQSWASTFSDKATLGVLIEKLNNCRLTAAGDALKAQFYKEESSSTVASTSNPQRNDANASSSSDDLHKRQAKYIQSKMEDLLDYTKLNIKTITLLTADETLSSDDVDEIESCRSEKAKIRKFYELIMTRPESFDKLITAMEKTRQSGVERILKAFYS